VAGRPGAALLAGLLVTALIQSSSVSTIAIVGLVHAGALDLDAAAAAIVGANVGTTLPVQLLAFRPGAAFWLALAAVVLVLGAAGGRLRTWARLGLAFGCLMAGLTAIGAALAPLAGRPWFGATIVLLAQRAWLGLGAGVLLSTVVLSSGVTMGVLQRLADQGVLPLAAALPVVFGSNVGTTTDTLLASLGAGRPARRAALFHVLFNVVGALGFMLARGPCADLLTALGGTPARQVANAHLLFNLVSAAVLFPLRGQLLRLTELLLPPSR
jgi:phosphate:Na+ symporter